MFGLDEIAEIKNVRHALTYQLVDQAAVTQLIVRLSEIFGSHAHQQGRGDGGFARRRHDVLDIVASVEEVAVGPMAAMLEQTRTLGRKSALAKMLRHSFSRPQSAEVPDLHLRIGPVIFHVHGVVLAAFHDTIAVGIPAACDPAELQAAAHVRPQLPEKGIVSG